MKPERKTAYWMQREDERILEFIDMMGLSSPDLISSEVFKGISGGQIRERLAMLEYAGLVYCVGIDTWDLTSTGNMYLAGSIDASHQPTPSVDRVLRG